jgi:hypothetical protein
MRILTDALTGARFDDWIEVDSVTYGDEEPGALNNKYWTQVCDEHAKQYDMKKGLSRGTGIGICGVAKCDEQAAHQYGFDAAPKAKAPTPTTIAPPVAPSYTPPSISAPAAPPSISAPAWGEEPTSLPEVEAEEPPAIEAEPTTELSIEEPEPVIPEETTAPMVQQTASWKPRRKRPKAQRDTAQVIAGMTE